MVLNMFLLPPLAFGPQQVVRFLLLTAFPRGWGVMGSAASPCLRQEEGWQLTAKHWARSLENLRPVRALPNTCVHL